MLIEINLEKKVGKVLIRFAIFLLVGFFVVPVNTSLSLTSSEIVLSRVIGKTLPGVVSVYATPSMENNAKHRKSHVFKNHPGFEFFGNIMPFNNSFDHFDASEYSGSGLIISKDGYIVTNKHIVENSKEITVVLGDGSKKIAQLVGMDSKVDIAVLKIEVDYDLNHLVFGNSDKLEVGHSVFSVGNPYGLGNTVTTGIISALKRSGIDSGYVDYIQTDAAINKGNSGGGLFNSSGRVIGITNLIVSPSGGSIGIGFAIPSNYTKSVVDEIIMYGYKRRGWIGIKIQPISDDMAESLGMDKSQGVIITEIIKGSPADRSSLQVGDVITQYNANNISQYQDLTKFVAMSSPGKEITLSILHKNKQKKVSLVLGENDSDKKGNLISSKKEGKREDKKVEQLGIFLNDIDGNLVVTSVVRNSSSYVLGFRAGDVIKRVNYDILENVDHFISIIDSLDKSGHKSVSLLVTRGDKTLFIVLPLNQGKN